MKSIITFLLLFSVVHIGSSQTKIKSIKLENKSDFSLKNGVVEVPFSLLGAIDTSRLVVLHKTTKKQIPYQFDHDGEMKLLLLVSIPAQKSITVSLSKGQKEKFRNLTFGRYVPERLEDFAWENDKIAFRMYGKALEGTKGDAYGIDVWVKRTDSLIIDKRYGHGDYHNDRGDGLDYYHVGKTLGAGNVAPMVNDKIYYSGNYTNYEVLANGPLRTRFRLKYNEWDVNGKKTNVVKEITLDAGSQYNKIKATYSFVGDTLPLAIGVIKREGKSSYFVDEINGQFTFWEPEFKKDGITGVGIVLPKGFHKFSEDKDQYLIHTTTKEEQSITYYQGAAWNKAKEITNAIDWINYTNRYASLLSNGIKVTTF